MSVLHNLGLKYNTDKAIPHNYLRVYEDHLRHLVHMPLRFMEIGVLDGGSLRMWEEFFPKGHIVGLDIADKSFVNSDRISTIIGDQSDRAFLNNINVHFDVILDDGGHRMDQQMISFGSLFEKVYPGGIYIIEDLVTSLMPNYGGNPENNNTMLSALHDLQQTGKIESNFLLKPEKQYIQENVKQIYIYGHYGNVDVSTQAITAIIIKK